MENTREGFEQFAIVEIMGHQTYAGLVTEQVIGGSSFVRVDVPAIGEDPGFTKLFGASSIYCITPTSEEFARAVAARHKSKPVNLYMPELHPQRQIVAPEYDPDGPSDYDELTTDED